MPHIHSPDTFERSSHRTVSALLVIGAMCAGVTFLDTFMNWMMASLDRYYGLESAFRTSTATGPLPISSVQALVAAIIMGGFVIMLVANKFRIARIRQHKSKCARSKRWIVAGNLGVMSRAGLIGRRTLLYSFLQMGIFLVQIQMARFLNGDGFNLGLQSLEDLFALGTILSLALVTGFCTALLSTVGLRTLIVLKIIESTLRWQHTRLLAFRYFRSRNRPRVRTTPLERFGNSIWSRPPPAVA